MLYKTDDFSEGFSLVAIVFTSKSTIKLCYKPTQQKFPFSVKHAY